MTVRTVCFTHTFYPLNSQSLPKAAHDKDIQYIQQLSNLTYMQQKLESKAEQYTPVSILFYIRLRDLSFIFRHVRPPSLVHGISALVIKFLSNPQQCSSTGENDIDDIPLFEIQLNTIQQGEVPSLQYEETYLDCPRPGKFDSPKLPRLIRW